ncbi:PadR family transcriptional regulator [Sphingosinicella sp.]|uniref:PadR family transcriptional regulator n=1 Tax=Sphingosinicella sp. TaxID=1917971 RepID=UPI004037758F
MTQRQNRSADRAAAAPADGLTDNEGSLLALMLRRQPVTAYQLLRLYEQSPVSSFNESKGSLYPLIRRLKARGLIAAQPIAGDGRKSERLNCTAAGRAAARHWVKRLEPRHILPDDPLRTKAISFELLDAGERSAWIKAAKALTEAKIAEVEAYMIGLDLPHKEAIEANALGALQARLDWLDRLAGAVSEPPA